MNGFMTSGAALADRFSIDSDTLAREDLRRASGVIKYVLEAREAFFWSEFAVF